jgi:formate hydrogenlyase subunit 6/NADH:ubiquinone oxidoreductase subunit I
LPWVFDRPCIVCEENCPLSPKAIYTEVSYITIRDGSFEIQKISGNTIETASADMQADKFATGDYYCLVGPARLKILSNSENTLILEGKENLEQHLAVGGIIKIQVRLQRPYVDPEKCTGCGVCEHECPVSGKRAIRVSAEGESRSKDRKLLLD